ncbi:MAG: cupin domain-containing protein [Bosea sp. (in: a-proteobacteria)]|uniref:cupin domain-containing protein n=1 Tax=Bosea sp. (in: a-proteobacteria) TaxID=1871050 RepID=UPI003F7C8CBC
MALQHAKSREIVDLRPLGGKLKSTKTAAIVKSQYFEAVRLVVPAGTKIPPHKVPGNIMLHCLEGRISLGVADSSLALSSGEWVYLDGGEVHSLEGIEDASLLLTILLRQG